MNKFKERIECLRAVMRNHAINAYMVVTDDFHSSEYVDEYFKGRGWLSGFTGSAGTLVVGLDWAGLWTDGRYFLQAEEQLSGSDITLFKMGEPGVLPIPKFLKTKLSKGDVLGYDARTVNTALGESLKSSLAELNIQFKTDKDLLEEIWLDRPPFPKGKIWLLDEKYSGKSVSSKLSDLRLKVKENGASSILISSLDDIAWLYNFRGSDVLYTPVAMAYTIVKESEAIIYLGENVADTEITNKLRGDGITIKDYFQVYEDVKKEFGQTDFEPLMVDKDSVNEALVSSIANPIFAQNPTTLAKAVKNPVERENIRLAHLKDGIALTKLIYQVKKMDKEGTLNNETELSIEKKLTNLRKSQEDFISLSFDSIVATQEHGAIVHYEPTPESDKPIGKGFLLIDTGGQYLQGTTDVTRTLSIGEPTDLMKTHYTAVLMGNLNLGGVVFPKGTLGSHLDVLARKHLWDLGLDYNHGTGHGVGYLLNVHEGPNSVRKGLDTLGFGAAFEEGMVTSNEPGYYLAGQYGIRIENLILCVKSQMENFLKFDTLTLAPYDRKSIKTEMLSPEQITLLNAYHKMVFEKLSPYLTEEEKAWLKEETAEI